VPVWSKGVLPLAQVKSLLFGNSLVSLPFAVYGGVAATSPAAAEALEWEAQAIARRLGVAITWNCGTFSRVIRNGRRQDLYVSFRKAIAPEVDANMLAIPRKQRAMVRKGIKNGLRSEIDADPGRFFRALRRQRPPSWHAGNAPSLFRSAAAGVRCRLRSADRRGRHGAFAEQRAELLFSRRGAALLRR
jgi:hypothetical protein